MENKKTITDTVIEQTTTVVCDQCKKIPIITKHIPPSGQDNFNAVCDCKKTPLIHGINAAEQAKNEWESKYYKMSPIEVNKESGWESNTLYYETELEECTSCKQVPIKHQYNEDGTVYYNLICNCKRTPRNRGTMGVDTHTWNTKWFDTDPKIVNNKAGWQSESGEFNYYT